MASILYDLLSYYGTGAMTSRMQMRAIFMSLLMGNRCANEEKMVMKIMNVDSEVN